MTFESKDSYIVYSKNIYINYHYVVNHYHAIKMLSAMNDFFKIICDTYLLPPIYHKDSYVLLCGKRKLLRFDISRVEFL